jgi:hypothetical protein
MMKAEFYPSGPSVVNPNSFIMLIMRGIIRPLMPKKRFPWLRLLLAAIALYAAWLAFQAVNYKRYVSDPAAAASPADGPQPPPQVEIRGAYHVHTTFSDGRKTVDRVIESAISAGLDFIILTDHGSPNRRSLAAAGRRNGLLVLAGTEISSSRGHLVALAFDPPPRRFPQSAEAAAREVRSLGGFTVIAHPFSKTRWSWGGPDDVYDGLEIMDSDTVLKRNIGQALFRLPLMLVRPRAVLLKVISRPAETLARWDRLLAEGPRLGFYSVDAHWMYETAFSLFQIRVLLDRPPDEDFATARGQVFEALRAGRFFSAIDAAADPAGFRFWLDGGTLRLRTPFSFAHEARIIQDGRVVATTTERAFALPAAAPGAYRVEAYLRERSPLGREVPWVISNPVVVPAGRKENR